MTRKVRVTFVDQEAELLIDVLDHVRKNLHSQQKESDDYDALFYLSKLVNVSKTEATSPRNHYTSIKDIIRELERKEGAAHIDTIIEKAAKVGFHKDEVEAEIARLMQVAAIMEPVRYSCNYRLTQQW
jgi:DNA replicative helicase MCM subunit Mcm2 (Cdc46/Mcm family)